MHAGAVGATLGLFADRGPFEIRIPKAGRWKTIRGYFDDVDAAVEALEKWNTMGPGVYVTLNPINEAVLARCYNRMEAYAETTTSDADVVCRRWLLVDVDPTRPSGISSSDAEHKAAIEKAKEIGKFLKDSGWPSPVFADSGNGAHLLYSVNLPNTNANRDLVRSVLKGIAARFDDDAVTVDQSVFNAARISKVYGTLTAKGDDLPDRPHRMTRIIKRPVALANVDLSLLRELASEAQGSGKKERSREPRSERPSDFFGTVNSLAMDGLSRWVPDLFGDKARPYHGGFRVSSSDLGRGFEEDLSIVPEGIQDFGPEKGQTAIDVALEWGGHARPLDAALWLCHRLGHDPSSLGYRSRGKALAPLVQSPTNAMATEAWPMPDPLPDGLPAVPELDPALLPASIRPWIEDIAERIQCPIDYPAIGAMVDLAAVVGRQVGIRPRIRDDWTVIPNLWGGIVGRPGMLKTPALSEVMRPLQRLEAAAREVYEAAKTEHTAAAAVAKAAAKQSERDIGKAMREGKHDLAREIALASVADDDGPPDRRRYVTSDTTVEALGVLLAANPRGVLIYRDELTGWLRDLDREGREGSRAFYLESWNGNGRFTYDRIGRGTIDIEAACVSVLGGIQPGPLSAYLRDALDGGVGDDGLLQRLQLVAWPDAPRSWRNVDRWPDTAARRAAWEVFERLDAIDPAAIGARQDDPDGLHYLRLDDAAHEAFIDWRTQLEQRLRGSAEHPAFEAALAKQRSLVPSIALLTHLADCPAGGPVTEAAMAAALAWTAYLEAHARRLYAPALDPALHAARELDRHILAGDIRGEFQARDIYRRGWRLLDRRGTEDALEYLEDLGRVRSDTVETSGRPRTVWTVNPALVVG